MSDESQMNGEEALDKTMTTLKKLKTVFPNAKVLGYIVAFLSMGGGSLFLWVWDQSQDHIVRVATPHIIHYADSIALSKIENVLDSIEQDRLINKSFEHNLSLYMDVPEDSLDSYIGRWFNREKNIFQVGLFKDTKRNKLLYKHTNGEIYRAVYRQKYDYYYYFNDQGEWKQVK